MPEVQGIHHVALTVSDLERSTEWYEKVLDANRVMEMELFEGHQIQLIAIGPVVVGLHCDGRVPAGDRFDEFRCGLDHIGLACASRGEVEEWKKRFEELGVEHSDITDAPYGAVLVFRDPDNIQLEMFAPPG